MNIRLRLALLRTKLAAKGIKQAQDDPMSRDPTSSFQRFRQKKMDERIDELFERGVKPPETKQEEYHVQKFVEKGIKIRPPRVGVKQRQRMISAKLGDMFNPIENPIEEDISKFKAFKGKFPEGFTFIDEPLDAFEPEQSKKIFERLGRPDKKIGLISVTTKEFKTPEEARPDLESILKEGKRPQISGFKGNIEASFPVHFEKDEDILPELEKRNQESALVIEPDFTARILKNPKFRGAIIEDVKDVHPIILIHEGKVYRDLDKILVGQVKSGQDKTVYIGIENIGDHKVGNFRLFTNAKHTAKLPKMINPGSRQTMIIKMDGSSLTALKKEKKTIETKLRYDEFVRE